MENQTPVLSLHKICKSFSGVQVLKDVDLQLIPGQVHCLVGENGAGKSTLIKIISGAYQPDSGEIYYQGQALQRLNPHWARENGINAIYQEIDLIPSLSVAENIFLGNEPLDRTGNIDWKKIQRRASEILDSMGAHLDLDAPVGSLKVAYQQMVAIAKALSQNSQVLILDEPTAVFTSSEVELLFSIIERLKSQGLALLYISHHMEEIFEIGDWVTVLRDGCLIRSAPVDDFDKNSLIKAMVGRDIDFSQRSINNSDGEELFRVVNLSRKGVVNGINFSLKRGEILGVAGLVGAGRTEMARLIVGADTPDQGEFFLRGQHIDIHNPSQAMKLRIGMLPESRKEEGLVLVRSVRENIAYAEVERSARFGMVDWKRIRSAAARLTEYLSIRPANPNIQVHFLSGGNQQKVVLSKLLAAGCDVLILDEPTRGVDVGARMEIYKLMQEMKAEGKAILMISSDLPEILTQTDRILVMAKGKISAEMLTSTATEETVLSAALQVAEVDE